jgi:hypothetical protein
MHGNKQGGGDPTQKNLFKDQTLVPAVWYFKESIHRMIRLLGTSLQSTVVQLAMWYRQLQNSVFMQAT